MHYTSTSSPRLGTIAIFRGTPLLSSLSSSSSIKPPTNTSNINPYTNTITNMASSSSSSNSQTMTSRTFTGLGNLIKLLPTGTVFLFQFLNPVVTDTGHHCTATNKIITSALFVACAFNCCFACFTDSYTGSDKQRHYSIVTTTGLWPSPASDKLNMVKYKLRVGDFAHALLGLVVFAVLALLDTNTVRCFYPGFESTGKILIQVMPPVIGVAAGAVFMLFPNTRHGIGYPFSSGDENNKDKKESTNESKHAQV